MPCCGFLLEDCKDKAQGWAPLPQQPGSVGSYDDSSSPLGRAGRELFALPEEVGSCAAAVRLLA